MSAAWQQQCPYDGPQHAFRPLREHISRVSQGLLPIVAICAKCGALR